MPACKAPAQTSGSIALVSDYRYRGVSLSDGNPEPQLSLGYDNPHGWYAGTFASPVIMPDKDNRLQLIVYSGYAQRLPSDITIELGAIETTYLQASQYDYGEAFAGISTEHSGARIYASPRYIAASRPSLYAELNASYPVQEQIDLIAQFGFLHIFEHAENNTLSAVGNSENGRLGMTYHHTDWTWQLAWIGSEQHTSIYRSEQKLFSHTFLLSSTYSF